MEQNINKYKQLWRKKLPKIGNYGKLWEIFKKLWETMEISVINL
jgi:hypothetical protein